MASPSDADSKQGAPTIYIDDPISSLDSNHVFFVFSLIEDLIAKPNRDEDGAAVYSYTQLFVSTHNLDFLKYLKRLTVPKKGHEHFLIVNHEGASRIELMPEYLRSYVTEFNYLFGEIYVCSDPANAATAHHCFYNFGNNLRRFLEAFLFFKYPATSQISFKTRIERFCQKDGSAATLMKKLADEHSHLEEVFDRATQPIDYAEISKVATFVLKKVSENDCEQFACLLESIGKPDPFDSI